MRVLLTGGTGLIGRRVGQLLVEAGHEVRVLTRHPDAVRLYPRFPCEVFLWKGHDEAMPLEAFDGVEGVIHLAGEPIANARWTQARKDEIWKSRVDGTRRLMEAIQASSSAREKLQVIVSGSAIGIYGNRGDEVLEETAASGSDFLARLCREWEAEVEKGLPGVRKVFVRTSMVLARESGALPKMLPPFQQGAGGALGSGEQWMSWIHLEDIARLLVFSLENDRVSGPVNGAAPYPERNLDFSKKLAAAFRKKLLFPVPALALKALFGELSEVLLASQRCSARKVLDLGFQFRFTAVEEALSELLKGREDGSDERIDELWIPVGIERVFEFFSDAKNLETITPDFLSFQIVSVSTPQVQLGTRIEYKLRLNGIPMKWISLISDWRPGERFVDEQVKGPYRKWHHTHAFTSLAGGTLVRDRVLFKLPMGVLGKAVAGMKVTSDLKKIFAYRRKKIRELLVGQ